MYGISIRASRRHHERKARERRRQIASRTQRPCVGVWREVGDSGKGYVILPRPMQQKDLKRRANRAVRRYKGELGNGGSYKRLFEYEYNLW